MSNYQIAIDALVNGTKVSLKKSATERSSLFHNTSNKNLFTVVQVQKGFLDLVHESEETGSNYLHDIPIEYITKPEKRYKWKEIQKLNPKWEEWINEYYPLYFELLDSNRNPGNLIWEKRVIEHGNLNLLSRIDEGQWYLTLVNPDNYYDELLERIWEETETEMLRTIKIKNMDLSSTHLGEILTSILKRLAGIKEYQNYQGINCNPDHYICYAETFIKVWEKADNLSEKEMMSLAFNSMVNGKKVTTYDYPDGEWLITGLKEDGRIKVLTDNNKRPSGYSIHDINWNK